MDNRVLAILDREEAYAYGLLEYFEQKDNLPFRVHIFTDTNRFIRYNKKEEIECLLVSESCYLKEIEESAIPHILILSESGKVLDGTLHHIDKYQSCEKIFREIITYYSEKSETLRGSFRKTGKKMKVIAVYTPIGRCLQTTLAFTLGQVLGNFGKALYMNFEKYSGFSSLLRRNFDADISDLMYYFECSKEKLAYRIDSIVENVGGLDFVPPAEVFHNLTGVKNDQWLELFSEIEKCTEYEYLILDITDGMLNLWDILRYSDVIYTITKGDPMAIAKVSQYEKALEDSEYSGILEKTRKLSLPVFRHLPQKFEDLTKSELAAFIKDRMIPDIMAVE